ncbi:DUF4767 domain-containing protein [Lactiplantibacillus pentosus]|uniref:DUF4767 domain-containing protein n=1 Tax=Lactiplantibacillus pentosus TaxID=1589 RepID=UPI0013300D76|nr:DUF4767 domain-containing protein [Lactiplantibacillus pentosus]
MNQMKRMWVGLILGSLLLAGCSSQSQSATKQSSAKTTTTKVKHSQSKQANAASVSDDSASSTQATLWNTGKKAALSTFMASWQSEMGQTYVGTYDDKAPDHLAYHFPEVFKNGQLDGHVKWGSQAVSLKWSTDGEDSSPLQVVAVATGGKSEAIYPITYFFCLHNQRPVVLVTETTNGDQLILHDTQNSALQAGFAKIITGTKPAILSDTSLTAGTASAVDANQWPQTYRGTWYYYDEYSHKVQSFTQNSTDDLKLDYEPFDGRKWINIKGAHQGAGAGNYVYLRYHYFDGRQIPVMMMGSGAEAWFDGNAYQSAATAQQMQRWQYGDETKDHHDF